MYKENVVDIQTEIDTHTKMLSRILFNLKKERKSSISSNMDELRGHYAK